jgi:cytochrome c biogenesis protein CcmG/thiol:disulfide interchange protein DsbE
MSTATPSRSAGSTARPARGARNPILGVALALGLVVALVVALMTSADGSDDDLVVSYDRDTQALSFRGETFSGQTIDTGELRGTPIVLNFYASWCTVCDRELPDFQRVSERLDGEVHVLGVNPQSNDTDAAQAKMIERSGVTYPTFADPQDELLRQFNTTGGLPTTVFIDGDGVVRKVYNGLLTEELLLDEIAGSLGVRT